MYHKGSVDIIGMLVDIYGSTDLFLNEYRALLSGSCQKRPSSTQKRPSAT